uniref:Uncharacterized protein n=1 Tax=Phytophthora fragariae TaxID=53985 RepID=A0A6A3EM74_9STRA|nr:hypothetical protein PF009_g17561 [Phytophthora fragariae]
MPVGTFCRLYFARLKGRECQPTTAVRCSSAATAQTPPPPDSAGTCGGADFEQLGCGTPTTQRGTCGGADFERQLGCDGPDAAPRQRSERAR